MEYLLHLDRVILLAINGLAGNTLLDSFMLYMSSKWIWIPFYVLILLAIFKQLGWQRTGWICIASFIMVVMTDQGSVRFFKEVFERVRPCHLAELSSKLASISGKCGGKYGFVSSHAANVFGLAVFVSGVLKKGSKWWYLMFLWAFLISLSRVYLGVHYPSDVIVGGLYGGVIGYLTVRLTMKIVGRP